MQKKIHHSQKNYISKKRVKKEALKNLSNHYLHSSIKSHK